MNPPRVLAPGKLLLFGEYAVLDGELAVVAAVNRHARCDREPAEVVTVEAPALGSGPLPFARAALAHATWPVQPARYVLDTEALADRAPDGTRRKLGLGGSAASVVALLGATVDAPLDAPELRQAIFSAGQGAHREAQGGRGSGADVAASVFGGLLSYRWREGATGGAPIGDLPEGGVHIEVRGHGTAVIGPAPVPRGFRLLTVFTGAPASTPDLVAQVRAFAEASPVAYAERREALARAARRGLAALGRRDVCAVQEAVWAGARAVAELANASGAPLVPPMLPEVEKLIRRHGCAFKPTGAGGGDLVWIVGADRAQEAALENALRREGHPVYLFSVDPSGVRLG